MDNSTTPMPSSMKWKVWKDLFLSETRVMTNITSLIKGEL